MTLLSGGDVGSVGEFGILGSLLLEASIKDDMTYAYEKFLS
jgi:hypothetical protein